MRKSEGQRIQEKETVKQKLTGLFERGRLLDLWYDSSYWVIILSRFAFHGIIATFNLHLENLELHYEHKPNPTSKINLQL